MNKKIKGFTLFEMMIVIAIIGVLAAFAIPSYQKYVLRSNRAAAAAMMMDIAGLLENHHLQNGSYSTSYVESINNDSNYNAAPGSNNKLYSIQIVTSKDDNQTYVIKATPVSNSEQAKDECGELILNNFGAKSAKKGRTIVDGCW